MIGAPPALPRPGTGEGKRETYGTGEGNGIGRELRGRRVEFLLGLFLATARAAAPAAIIVYTACIDEEIHGLDARTVYKRCMG